MGPSSQRSSPPTRQVRVDATGSVKDLSTPFTSPGPQRHSPFLIDCVFDDFECTDTSSNDGSSSEPSSSDSLEPTTAPQDPKESEAVLDLMDNLEDIDEAYMLSVFWNSGDSMANNCQHERSRDGSVSGNTACSFASTTSTSTSLSNYTWTSSRRRHKGGYHKRSKVVKKAPNVVASWIDTMHESTSTLLGPLNEWSMSRGWQNPKGEKFDFGADVATWGSLDPVFDKVT